MDNPVQGITGQVEAIYEKAITEIEQEEAEVERQISRLIEKKAILNKKRQHIHRLRSQVEEVTDEIEAAEEAYQAELQKKTGIDAQIQKMTEALKRLKAEAQQVETSLQEVRNARRAKYQSLAEMVEKFGDSVTSRLSEDVVTELEETMRDPNDHPSTSASPEIRLPQTDDLIDAPEDEIGKSRSHTPPERASVDDTSESETADDLDMEAEEEFGEMEDEEATAHFDEETEIEMSTDEDEEEEAEALDIETALRKSSTEADRLRQVFDVKPSDADDDALNLDFEDLMTDDDEGDMSEFDKLLSQADVEGREAEAEALDMDEESEPSTENETEELTSKTAKTPRKRRNLLMSYLKNKDE